MDESKRRVIQFLEKKIKTYTALALFLSKEGVKERVRLGDTGILLSPAFYGENERSEETCI